MEHGQTHFSGAAFLAQLHFKKNSKTVFSLPLQQHRHKQWWIHPPTVTMEDIERVCRYLFLLSLSIGIHKISGCFHTGAQLFSDSI